ncbi:hypothetical protein ACQ4LE_009348 [Meloidogyne hapla]
MTKLFFIFVIFTLVFIYCCDCMKKQGEKKNTTNGNEEQKKTYMYFGNKDQQKRDEALDWARNLPSNSNNKQTLAKQGSIKGGVYAYNRMIGVNGEVHEN